MIASMPIHGTVNSCRVSVEHMGINYCPFDLAMPRQRLDNLNVIPAFKQV